MVESKQSYEECRRKRIEENKKRMEELNLGKLALAFKASTTPKSSAVKRPRATPDIASLPVRRSSRIASKTRVRTAKNLSRNKPPSKPPVIRFESADPPHPTAFVKADLSSFKQVVQMLTGSSNQATTVPDPPSETKQASSPLFPLLARD